MSEERTLTAWQRAAEQLDGEYSVRERRTQDSYVMLPSISATVADVRVSLDARLGNFAITATHGAAWASGALGLRLSLRRGHVYPIGRVFGIEDLIVDDERFDDRFIIKSNDIDYAKAWLGPRAREDMYDVDGFRFSLTGESVTFSRRGIPDSTHAIVSALRGAAALAGQGRDLLARWNALATALGSSVPGSPMAWKPDAEQAIATRGGDVAISCAFSTLGRRRSRRLFTVVSSRRVSVEPDAFALHQSAAPRRDVPKLARELDRVELACADYLAYGSHADRLRARIPRDASTLIAAATPHAVLGDAQHVRAYLPGFVDDAQRITAATHLVHALAVDPAAGATGPYR